MPPINPGVAVDTLTPDTGDSDAYDQTAASKPSDISNNPS